MTMGPEPTMRILRKSLRRGMAAALAVAQKADDRQCERVTGLECHPDAGLARPRRRPRGRYSLPPIPQKPGDAEDGTEDHGRDDASRSFTRAIAVRRPALGEMR